MHLKVINNIENNVFSSTITIDAYGDVNLSSEQEKDLLANFPSDVVYRTLEFKKNMTLQNGVPVTTLSPKDDNNIVEITLPALTNKEIRLGDDFVAEYKIDTNRIPPSAMIGVFNTKELLAQAYCIIFKEVIYTEVKRIMDELRTKAPSFEGEEIVTV